MSFTNQDGDCSLCTQSPSSSDLSLLFLASRLIQKQNGIFASQKEDMNRTQKHKMASSPSHKRTWTETTKWHLHPHDKQQEQNHKHKMGSLPTHTHTHKRTLGEWSGHFWHSPLKLLASPQNVTHQVHQTKTKQIFKLNENFPTLAGSNMPHSLLMSEGSSHSWRPTTLGNWSPCHQTMKNMLYPSQWTILALQITPLRSCRAPLPYNPPSGISNSGRS